MWLFTYIMSLPNLCDMRIKKLVSSKIVFQEHKITADESSCNHQIINSHADFVLSFGDGVPGICCGSKSS